MGLRLLTAREARELLRVSPATLRAMVDRGDLVGFRHGRLTRIRADSVERFVAGTDGQAGSSIETETNRASAQ